MRSDTLQNNTDKAIVIAYPDNWAKWHSKWSDRLYNWGISTNKYYEVGHAAILLVDGWTGDISYYDFGRYTTGASYGRVRSAETDPLLELKIKASFDKGGSINNLDDIIVDLDKMKTYTHGDGKVIFSVCEDVDIPKAKTHIDELIKKCCIPYSPFSKDATNCSRFVASVIAVACDDAKIREAVINQSTFAATPIGNVINATSDRVINEYNSSLFKTISYNRTTELINIVTKLLKSTFLTKRSSGIIHSDALSVPIRVQKIPKCAQWLNGIGEGAWIAIQQLSDLKFHYKINRYDSFGDLEYSIIAIDRTEQINLKQWYKIDYNCNRLITTIKQNGKLNLLEFVKNI